MGRSDEYIARRGQHGVDDEGIPDLHQPAGVADLLVDGERIVYAYKSLRDGVAFTNKRIIAEHVQGMTGSKKDFTSLPCKNIVAY